MKNVFCVYKHTNNINKKVYIGITCQKPNRRWHNGLGYVHNKYFYSAIVKYGWDNFKHEILFTNLSKSEAEQKEIDLIKHFNSTNRYYGYNIHSGGDTRIGNIMPKGYDNKRHKIVEQYDLDGNYIKEYGGLRQAGRELNVSHKTIAHCCNNDCKTAYGYQWKYKNSDKRINKIIRGQTHRPNISLYHPIICIETNIVYNSIKEATNKTNAKNISACCRGARKTSGGFHWEYLQDGTKI